MSFTDVARYGVVEVGLGPVSTNDDDAAARIVDMLFTDPEGRQRLVPAFVSGGEWRVRYSSELPGTHRYEAEASSGVVTVRADKDPAGLLAHGPLRVAPSHRHLEHADGTPFFWLADTWWHGFVDRLSDQEFRDLAAKRAQQGFSVVQIVAGLYPEMVPFAPEGRSSSGWAWHDGFGTPNLAWFDEADRRVKTLVEHNLVPCVFGSWAYYLQFMTPSQLIRHWREMIARWGAYPVVWALAGEPPLVLTDEIFQIIAQGSASAAFDEIAPRTEDESAVSEQLRRLEEVARGIRRLDPYGRPVTVHAQPGKPPWEYFENEGLIDFWLLQTGHSGQNSLQPSVNTLHEGLERVPTKPVINGEVCYEGICGSSLHEIQRFLFWSHILSGAAGHTYGAQGIWGFNTPDYPCGLAGRWADAMWQEAATLPGATHLGIGRRLLLDLPWHQFEPHPEWVDPHQHPDDRLLPYAAGIPNGPRAIYFPAIALLLNADLSAFHTIRVRDLGSCTWQAQYINHGGQRDGQEALSPECG